MKSRLRRRSLVEEAGECRIESVGEEGGEGCSGRVRVMVGRAGGEADVGAAAVRLLRRRSVMCDQWECGWGVECRAGWTVKRAVVTSVGLRIMMEGWRRSIVV